MASAKIALGDQLTEPVTGKTIVIEGSLRGMEKQPQWQFGYWMFAKAGDNNSWWFTRGGQEDLTGSDKEYLFELQATDETVTVGNVTYPGYRLYSPTLKKYAAPIELTFNFKNNPERAETFFFLNPVLTTQLIGKDVEAFKEETGEATLEVLKTAFCMVVRSKAADGVGTGLDGYDYKALNRFNNERPWRSSFANSDTWVRLWEGSELPVDAKEELGNYVSKLEPFVNNIAEGTLPGCAANTEAMTALKTAFADAQNVTADNAADKLAALQQAYETFISFGQNGFVPLTAGYWYITLDCTKTVNEVKKAMYADGNNLMWGTYDTTDKNYMWQVEGTTDPERFILRNVNTLGFIHQTGDYTKTSANSVECRVQQSKYGFPRFTMGNGNDLFAFYHDKQESSGISTWHFDDTLPEGHGGAWAFVPVEEDVENIKANMEQIVRNKEYGELLQAAHDKYSIAISYKMCNYPEDALISYTPTEEEKAMGAKDKGYGSAGEWKGGTVQCYKLNEGGVGALCDNEWGAGTKEMNSDWNASRVTENQYVQFDLEEEVENVAFFYNGQGHSWGNLMPTVADIQVCKDTSAVGGNVWKTVKTIYPNYFWAGENGVINGVEVAGSDDCITEAVPLKGKYKHIRFVQRQRANGKNADGTYKFTTLDGKDMIHFTEANIMKVELDPECQLMALKNDPEIAPVIAALEEEFRKGEGLTNPTADDLAALQKTYDEFLSVFPDPTELKALIKDTEEFMGNMYVGTVPGTYASQDELDVKLLGVMEAIAGAQADIDEMTLYTKNQVEDHIAAITAARQALIDGSRPIDFTKWVRLYLTREYWLQKPDQKPADWVDNVAMYAPEDAESETVQIPFGTFNPDVATSFDWRFVPVKGGYFIQNRATGKFVGSGRVLESSRDWDPGLASVPALFTVENIGGGSFAIVGQDINGGSVANYDEYKYLHGATGNGVVTYWYDHNLGSLSGWEFEIQNADAFDDNAKEEMMSNALVVKHLVPNRLYTACYPTDVTFGSDDESKVVSVYTIAGKDADESVVYLEKMADEDGLVSIPAGTPVLYEIGEEGSNFLDYSYSEDEEANAEMQVYYDFYPTTDEEENNSLYVAAPQQGNGLTGIFSDQKIYKGHGLVSLYMGGNAVWPFGLGMIEEDDEVMESLIHRTEAYVNIDAVAVLGAGEAADYLELPIAGQVDNAIGTVTDGSDNAATVDVYTIDGVRVRANAAKADALKGLKPGLYIVNKTKIMVK